MKNLYDNLKKHMEYLCLECGPRQCGSVGERKAADYIESEFKKLGYETVREEYPTIGWLCEEFLLFNATKCEVVPCATVGYFSHDADLTAPITWIKGEDIKRLDKMDIKGKLCFIESRILPIPGGLNALAELLDSHGVAGAVFISADHTSYAPSTKAPRSPFMKNMATVTVSQEGVYYLYNNRDDEYRLKISTKRFDNTSYNIIARRSGGTKKAAIGAHYDTAPFIQGAGDDASGTAGVIELARIFKDRYNEYSFDFCAFSAEEYILDSFPEGSKDYIRRHKNEDIKWFVNLDGVGLKISDKILETSHTEMLPELDIDVALKRNATLSGDDKTFSYNGIPTVWIKTINPYALLHTEFDSLEYIIDFQRMTEHVADYAMVIDTLSQSEMFK